jgi:hypothetical protein
MKYRSGVLVAAMSICGLAGAAEPLAFPGAMGAAASTPGGRGGVILKVTTLAPSGPGSFIAAVEAPGPRIVVFEVGGVIDLGERTVKITQPNLTIAGQTAPAPGITLIRGGIDIATHDVVVQHLRVRPGDGGRARMSGNDYDAISTLGARDDKERSPLFKGGVRGAIINNLIYDPGPRAIHYNLIAAEWGDHPYQTGEMTVIGNVLRAGPSTPEDLALVMIGGSGDLALHERDNIAVDRLGAPLPLRGLYTTAPVKVSALIPTKVFGVTPMQARAVQDAVVKNAGARPWDRDAEDARIVANVIEGRGAIINSQSEVGGYPKYPETRQAFDAAAWNLDTMTRK